MIKIICTDLDGTLLRSDKTISEFSINTLRKLISDGLEIIPVTGRHFGGVPKEILSLDINYAICANGAYLYDIKNRKALKIEIIDRTFLDGIVKLCEKYEIMSDVFSDVYAYTDNRCLDVLEDVDASDAVKNYIKSSRKIVPDIGDFIRETEPDILKITMNFRYTDGVYKNRDKMLEYLKSNPELTAVTGGANNIEVTSSKATKGKCIKFISEYLSVPLSDFFAIGDTENDISMLETVENSCAMKNAPESIKKICKYTTSEDNDSDGAVKMMENIVKGERNA